MVSGTVSLSGVERKATLMVDENRRTNAEEESDRPNDGFDYGERREDGQFQNHPTKDEGEFVQPVRSSYVHVEECGATTTMGTGLAESFARDPEQYGKTFCAGCEDYYPLDEFEWKGTEIRLDEVGVVADDEEDPNGGDDLTIYVRGSPHSVPRDVETVADLNAALGVKEDRELVRVVEGEEEIHPGQNRLGVSDLGDPDDPVVISEGDEFLLRDRREGDVDDVERLYQSLEQVRRDLLDVAEQAEEAGVPLVARNLELWSHSAAVFHADLTHGPAPGTIVDYLEQADYEPPERGRENEEAE